MTAKQYMKRKNNILEDMSGVVLVPKEQIVKTSFILMNPIGTNANICPYCLIYNDCIDCPMENEDNNCGEDHSSYNKTMDELRTRTKYKSIHEVPEIIDLVKQYNAELGISTKLLKKLKKMNVIFSTHKRAIGNGYTYTYDDEEFKFTIHQTFIAALKRLVDEND